MIKLGGKGDPITAQQQMQAICLFFANSAAESEFLRTRVRKTPKQTRVLRYNNSKEKHQINRN